MPCLIIDGVADFLEKRGRSEHTLEDLLKVAL